jgi:hypothetical protein
VRVPRSVGRAAAAVALFAFAVWNGVFDFLVVRGEQGYLLEQARHAAGLGPGALLHEIMADSIAYAALVASGWAATTLVAGFLLIWYVRRAALRERA